jgi:hypothetical protein
MKTAAIVLVSVGTPALIVSYALMRRKIEQLRREWEGRR